MIEEWTEAMCFINLRAYDPSGINNLSRLLHHWGRFGLHTCIWHEFDGWNFSSSLLEKRLTLEELSFT